MIVVAIILAIAATVVMFILHGAQVITFPWERGKRG